MISSLHASVAKFLKCQSVYQLFACTFRSLEADIDLQHEINDQALQNINLSSHSIEENNRSPRRKKLRSNHHGGRKSYDFREYGVDARRRGAKHQRRKQNCMSLFICLLGEGLFCFTTFFLILI